MSGPRIARNWEFDLPLKLEARAKDPTRNPFVDPGKCRRFLDRAEAAFHKQVAGQAAR
jgi:hypothetical protein